MTKPRPSVWTRFRDYDPRRYAFGAQHLWLRRRRGGFAAVASVYWDPDGGRLRALASEPRWIQHLMERGHGWWAFVTEPREPGERGEG